MSTIKTAYRFPWLTLCLTLITITVYCLFYYLSGETRATNEIYTQLGAPSSFDIYDGHYWGVVLNSFLHNRIDMLIINVIGLWSFAAFIERRLGFHVLLLLGLFASFITSIIQFTISDDPGIGEMGVNYFLFFFIFTRSFYRETFKLKFRYAIVFVLTLLLGWFMYKNKADNWNIGIEAIIAGIIIGTLSGLISMSRFKSMNYIFPLLLMAIMSVTFFYAPWSSDWNAHEGFKAHQSEDLEKAKEHYKEALRINPDNKNASANLFGIRLDELSDKAYRLHNAGKYIEARVYYDKVLQLDPSNSWAKEQIGNLP